MKKLKFYLPLILVGLLFFASCGGGQSAEEAEAEAEEAAEAVEEGAEAVAETAEEATEEAAKEEE